MWRKNEQELFAVTECQIIPNITKKLLIYSQTMIFLKSHMSEDIWILGFTYNYHVSSKSDGN